MLLWYEVLIVVFFVDLDNSVLWGVVVFLGFLMCGVDCVVVMVEVDVLCIILLSKSF